MSENYIIEEVEALWPRLDQTYAFDKKVNRSMPCGPRDTNAEFSIQFRMDNKAAKALFTAMAEVYVANREPKWAEMLDNPFVKDDDGTFTHKAVLKGSYNGQVTNNPAQYDSQGNALPEDFQLTTGSTVNIAVKMVPYDFGGNQSVSLRITAIQVIKFVPREKVNPFKKVDGGFVMEDPNPFTKTKSQSNNVLAEADNVEPIKKAAKKPAAKPSEENLSSVVNSLFDDE